MTPPRRPPAEPEPETSEAASDQVEEQEVPTVHQALSRVMGEVQSISKDSRNTSQNFNFRGIDAVMNACGPALRRWGVIVVPVRTTSVTENYRSRQGASMKNVTMTVTFRFYGPGGDWIEAQAQGEAADAGDKATPKAHSVALRTVLLQALCIPTDEPDPDQESHERVHESGFERANAKDPGPRAPGRQAYNWPKDWRELGERMGALLGDEEAKVWIAQAVEIDVGEPLTVGELDGDQKRFVWDTLTKVLRSLDDDLKVDPAAFPLPTRKEIADEFAKHLDGAILNGPQWALSGDEAENGYPSRESVLDGAPDRTGPEADAQETLAKESREPTDEEIAEAQATLDEEAAAAAEHDREQARDASGK